MGIMPNRDVGKALKLSLGLDIPFWPQLPNVSYYEDMYAQASQHFPGIVVDSENQKIWFDSNKFEGELSDYSDRMAYPETLSLSKDYSVVYHKFLSKDLDGYTAIRGQLIGPISFGFKVMDENNIPIIYNDSVRPIVLDFIHRKINAQYHALKEKNHNAFVWLDEPGLGWVFSGLSGYDDMHAKQECRAFLDGLDGPGALHLCANVNLPYLLTMGTKILSFDAYQIELMPKDYAAAVATFITNGGIITWGIVPTNSATLELETPYKLAKRLYDYWQVVATNSDIDINKIAESALLAPARCCLKNIGKVGATDRELKARSYETYNSSIEERLVEKAFGYLKIVSQHLRETFSL
jgi:hypothetical protein